MRKLKSEINQSTYKPKTLDLQIGLDADFSQAKRLTNIKMKDQGTEHPRDALFEQNQWAFEMVSEHKYFRTVYELLKVFCKNINH